MDGITAWYPSAPSKWKIDGLDTTTDDIITAVEAYRLYAKQCDYPTHIGITEAGQPPFLALLETQAGVGPQRVHREFRVDEKDIANYTLGQALTVKDLASTLFVDVIGTSKGKGFQGVVKRHGFHGGLPPHQPDLRFAR